MQTLAPMTFEKALKMRPKTLFIDFFQQTTIDDLVFAAEHEIDLFLEGEESDIKNTRDLTTYKKYILAITPGIKKG